jgi:hypothetical protein
VLEQPSHPLLHPPLQLAHPPEQLLPHAALQPEAQSREQELWQVCEHPEQDEEQDCPQAVVHFDQHPPEQASPQDAPQLDPQPSEHPEHPEQELPQEAVQLP